MQYGFVIDHDSCIGCHACTVACKAENNVPVGEFRTWVKYVDEGTFPSVARHMLVQRCNQCRSAPCVTICPVNALEKREDGIIDIDRDACIGCRACMQACPYDAIYMNEDLGAVEKCHFCAHRIDSGLEPACVTACPVEALIPGDFDDPDSHVVQLTRDHETVTRAAYQGTGPSVYYKGASNMALTPGAATRGNSYLWSQRRGAKPESWPTRLPVVQDAAITLDVGHRIEWGWQVALYLVTKSIAAGAAILAPFATTLGLTGFRANWLPEIIALAFSLLTSILLIEDLARPWRFYRLLTRPNYNSWLVLGGIVLTLFTLLLVLSISFRFIGMIAVASGMRWVTATLALLVAGYTAFLFAQCRGRDLWRGPLFLPHLLILAILCGCGVMLSIFPHSTALPFVVIACSGLHFACALHDERRNHPTDNAMQAAAFLNIVRCGPFRAWRDGLTIGIVLGITAALLFPALTCIPIIGGLYLYEYAWIRAGQLPPLS